MPCLEAETPPTSATGDAIAAAQLDCLAASNPAEFIRNVAGYQWTQIVDWYRQGLLSTSASGGMTALLEHRKETVEKLLIIVRQQADHQSYTFVKQAALSHADTLKLPPVDAAAYAEQFAQTRQEIDWEVPGSKDPTSDMDVSLHGDGTEWSVRRFNELFALAHGGNESGVVFDTNLYAADFIPTNDDKEFIKTGPEDTQTVAIVFDYTFCQAAAQRADDAAQEAAALLHLRRHLSSAEWVSFIQSLIGANPDLGPGLEAVDQQFCYNRTAIARQILAAAPRSLFERLAESVAQVAAELRISGVCPPPDGVVWPLAVAETVNHHPALSRNDLMAAENRLYEARLDDVMRLRVAFALIHLDRKALSRQDFSTWDATTATCDQAYLALRTAISAACFFANECYATAGAKINVVGGKQKWSKGTNFGRLSKEHLRNIDYTQAMLIDSIIEQTGDLYKEIRHHPNADLGTAALAAAKYLHRWFNAQKHFYIIIGDAIGRSYPASFSSADAFAQVRKACGMGLEQLKRLPTTPVNAPEMEAHKRSVALHLFADEARWAELTASPALAAEVIQTQLTSPQLPLLQKPKDCAALLHAIQQIAQGILLDYHAWQRSTAPQFRQNSAEPI